MLSGQINLTIIDNIEDLFSLLQQFIFQSAYWGGEGGLYYGQGNYAGAIIYSIIQAINDIIW